MTADTPHLDVILSQAPIISVGHDGRSADLGKAESELSALKARVEAAEGLLREVSEFIDTESRVVKAMAERAQQITGSIDAAIQAAMESTEPKGS